MRPARPDLDRGAGDGDLAQGAPRGAQPHQVRAARDGGGLRPGRGFRGRRHDRRHRDLYGRGILLAHCGHSGGHAVDDVRDLCAAARADRHHPAGQGGRGHRDRRGQTDPDPRRAAGQDRPRGQLADHHHARPRADLPEDQGTRGHRPRGRGFPRDHRGHVHRQVRQQLRQPHAAGHGRPQLLPRAGGGGHPAGGRFFAGYRHRGGARLPGHRRR